MSAATARSVQPSVAAARRVPLGRRKRTQALKLAALTAVSAAVGLATAENLSHLSVRTSPSIQILSGNPTLKKSSDGENVRWHARKSKIYFDASLDNAGKHAREAVEL